MYEINIVQRAKRNFDKLDEFEKIKIRKALKKLVKAPHYFAKRLKEHELWSLKVGLSGFRIIFRIDEKLKKVIIIAIGRRRNIYDNLSV